MAESGSGSRVRRERAAEKLVEEVFVVTNFGDSPRSKTNWKGRKREPTTNRCRSVGAAEAGGGKELSKLARKGNRSGDVSTKALATKETANVRREFLMARYSGRRQRTGGPGGAEV